MKFNQSSIVGIDMGSGDDYTVIQVSTMEENEILMIDSNYMRERIELIAQMYGVPSQLLSQPISSTEVHARIQAQMRAPRSAVLKDIKPE